MGMTIQLPDWSLNYQVAAFGAYATILVESIYLILGGFENASLLSISILTNASAVAVAGLNNGASSTPSAITRICLTSLFLLWAIVVLPVDGTFDGTNAILCSVAHLGYQQHLQRNADESAGLLPEHQKCTKANKAPSKSSLHDPSTGHTDVASSSRNLRIFFGDRFCLEGALVPVTILGTVMTYSVFDFDLGFGLVFAFMSAFLSSVILLFSNYARGRGRRFENRKALQSLVNLLLIVGTFCLVLFNSVEFPEVDISWWRVTFGVAWFLFLFKTNYVACRFLIHATLFSCAACTYREDGIHEPPTQQASANCIWDDYITLPHLDQDRDNMCESTTYRITRQKGPDLVERFWLNDQEWFQLSPRSFVIFLVTCLALASFSGGALNSGGSFDSIGGHISKNTAFYITMAFTLVSTGHTPAGDSPELMFVPLRHSFPDWKATARAIIGTMLVHAYLILPASSTVDLSFATPLACAVMVPLLLAGIAKRLDSTGQQGKCEPGLARNTEDMKYDEATSSTTDRAIDSTLVYSSPRIKCLDLRVLLFGLSVTFFDIYCNQYKDEMFVTRWPISAVISLSVTAVWLFLETSIPRSRDVEPGILLLATTVLVAIFSHVNFLDAFGIYDDEAYSNSTHTMPVPGNARHSRPILIALWYTMLTSLVVVNRLLGQRKVEQTLPATDGPPRRDHLLFGFRVETLRINFAWQLKNSSVATCLMFAMVSSCLGESWPLEMDTTVAGLQLFALVIGFQFRPTCDSLDDDKRSLHHIAALSFSALMTILAISLSRHGVLNALVSDPKRDWKAGTWSALVFYQLFLVISLRLEGRGWCTKLKHAEEPPTGGL